MFYDSGILTSFVNSCVHIAIRSHPYGERLLGFCFCFFSSRKSWGTSEELNRGWMEELVVATGRESAGKDWRRVSGTSLHLKKILECEL